MGLGEVLDIPYPTVCKALMGLKLDGLVEEWDDYIVGKNGNNRRGKRSTPYRITIKGRMKLASIEKECKP